MNCIDRLTEDDLERMELDLRRDIEIYLGFIEGVRDWEEEIEQRIRDYEQARVARCH